MASCGRIKQYDLHALVEHMSKNVYRAKDPSAFNDEVLSRSLNLFGKDYKYSVLKNSNGELCNHYPSKIVVLEYETTEGTSHHESIYNMNQMQDLFSKSRFARCRTRFVAPVILVEGRHICRSATISGGTEMYGRMGLNFVFNSGENSGAGSMTATSKDSNQNETKSSRGDMQMFDRIRGHDIKLLKELSVSHICDLMLENKKVKYFLNVTSSEKVDKLNRYSEFDVWSLPYPGCEFFKIWRDKDYNAEDSLFDWTQDFVNTQLEIPPESYLHLPEICWQEYKQWNLVQITQNYLRVLLRYVQEGKSGILVHCISGWDRTPLFISLLRLSLWADGLIHKSLSALEVLYLTVAYDWYQFGHDLPDRLQKGEEIFFFCFYFLKYIQDDEFIVYIPTSRSRQPSRTDSDCPTGVLLDLEPDFGGSSLSLNSDTSFTSAHSHADTPPQLFMVGCPEEDGAMTSNTTDTSTTTPVYVPVRRRTQHQMSATDSSSRLSTEYRCNSPVMGSWQVVTRTGSYRDSPYSAGDGSHSHSSHRSSSSGELVKPSLSFSELAEYEPSTRRKRLEEVRSLFYNAYGTKVGFKNGPDQQTGLSSLVNTFAGKIAAFGSRLT